MPYKFNPLTGSLDYYQDGNVIGAASSTDNAIARYDGTTGKQIQNSLVTIGDTGALVTPSTITMSDDQWIGLGAAAGRIVFDDQTVDQVTFRDCAVGINTTNPSTGRLQIVVGTTREIGFYINEPTDTGTGNYPTGFFSDIKLNHATTNGQLSGFSSQLRVGTGISLTQLIHFSATPPATTGATVANAYGLYVQGQQVSGVTKGYGVFCAGASDTNYFAGTLGVRTTAPDRAVEINEASGNCLRLTYNDSNGGAANYSDFLVSSAGILSIRPSSNKVAIGSGTPAYTFEVYGNLTSGVDAVIRANSGADYVNLAINATKATGQANVLFQKNGVLKQQMGMDFANSGATDFYWYDQTLGCNNLYFNTSGDTLIGSSGTASTGGFWGSQIITAKASTRRVGINASTPQRTLDVSATGQITFGDGVLTTSTAGLYWYSDTNYGIYRSGGAWSAPNYVQLILKFATGIVIDGSGAGTAQAGTSIQPTVGNVGIGMIASLATARLHLPAGTATAGTAPLKFNSGALLTTATAGAVEFLTDKFYATITTGAARKELTLNDAALTSGRVPYVTTNGRLTDDADFTFATDTLTVTKIAATTLTGNQTYADAINLIFNGTTGTKIGTATTQKIGFWNAAPIVQPTTADAAATFVANTSGIVDDSATFDGYSIGQIIKALRNEGLLA